MKTKPPASRKVSHPEVETKTTLRLPSELHRALRHRAIDEGITFQTIVRRALEEYVKGDRS